MDTITMVSQIGMIALLIGVGVLIYKVIDFQEIVKKAFMSLLIYVALPAIILDSIFRLPITDDLMKQVLLVFAASIVIHSVGIFIGWLFFKMRGRSSQRRRELAILCGLGNAGFLGIPLCAVLFGPKGALLAAIFDMGMDVMIWTVAVYMLSGQRKFSWKPLKSMINFPFLSIMTGLMLALVGFRPPVFLADTLNILSGLTVPLAMIFVGVMLMDIIRQGNLARVRSILGTLPIKLIAMPLFVTFILLLLANAGLAFSGEVAGVLLVQASMPTFTFAAVIFMYCSADEELAALASVTSTVCALVTVPIVVGFGSWLLF